MFRSWFAVSVRAFLLPLLLLSLGVEPVPVAAQSERFDGLQIREIEYHGLDTLGEETLEHYLFGGGAGRAEQLDVELLDERIERLWSRELIDDLAIEAVPADDGVKLIIRVVERPILISLEYEGLERLARTDIAEQIDRQRLRLYENQPLQLGELVRLESLIEGLYQEKGYRFAEVDYVLADLARGRKVTFTIDEGDRVRIGDVEFDGNTVFSDLRLRLAMKKTKESGLLSRVTKKDIYNPATLDEDLEAIRDFYRKAGYKDALVARPEIEVRAGNPAAAAIAEQKRKLRVTIPVEEGERWKLGEITIDGNEVFSDELLLRQFERPHGDWLRSQVVDNAVESIDKLYQSVGYVFSEVSTEVRETGHDNIADLLVKIDEKDQFRVGRIDFQGNAKTQDKVLRREMLVHEGTVMSMTALQNSLLKIRQLNYFALDEEEPVEFEFDGEEQTVDLRLKGEEAERTELQFGGGYSELDGVFGQFAMRTTNFLGRGETLGVSVQAGGRRTVYDLEYRIPWFRDRPQSFAARLFSQKYDTAVTSDVEFEQEYDGASLTYGRGLGPFSSLSLTYTFADVRELSSTPGEDGSRLTRTDEFLTSSIRPVWQYNTLDSRFEPTRGLRLTGGLELAGSFLGGDTDYVRPTATATWFQPISRQPFKSSFGINAEAGYITSFGELDIFPQQRFFLGGDSSVRGFRSRSIVVRNEDGSIRYDGDFPKGGTKMLQVNLEYHVMPKGPFRVVFFGDAGGVFDDDQSFDPDLMRYSAGAELRIQVPLFPAPLRFIYSRNLDPLEDEAFDGFDFSLSTSF